MKSSTFLRVASIITLIYFAGHTSGMPWTPAVGPEELSVIDAMKSHPFDVIGSTRTYWDFYFGFGVIISLYSLVQAIVLWQLGSLAKTDALRLRPLVATLFLLSIVLAVLSWKYFFVIPVVTSVATSVCLALAFIAAGRGEAAEQAAPAVTNRGA